MCSYGTFDLHWFLLRRCMSISPIAMAENGRPPLLHPSRIRAHEKKLWARELSWAIHEQIQGMKPELKMVCLCKLCDKGSRKRFYVSTVLNHFEKEYGRDPKHYGSSMVSALHPFLFWL